MQIKIVEKHRDSVRTEYRGEYGYFWLSSQVFSGKVESLAQAFTVLETHYPNTHLAPLLVDTDKQAFKIQVIDKTTGHDEGTFWVFSDGKIKNM